jgi:hypothetical protein
MIGNRVDSRTWIVGATWHSAGFARLRAARFGALCPQPAAVSGQLSARTASTPALLTSIVVRLRPSRAGSFRMLENPKITPRDGQLQPVDDSTWRRLLPDPETSGADTVVPGQVSDGLSDEIIGKASK